MIRFDGEITEDKQLSFFMANETFGEKPFSVFEQARQEKVATLRQDCQKEVVPQLVNLRHFRGKTQEDIDALMGHADRLYSKYECGLRSPGLFQLHCLMDEQVLDGAVMIVPKQLKEEINALIQQYYSSRHSH